MCGITSYENSVKKESSRFTGLILQPTKAIYSPRILVGLNLTSTPANSCAKAQGHDGKTSDDGLLLLEMMLAATTTRNTCRNIITIVGMFDLAMALLILCVAVNSFLCHNPYLKNTRKRNYIYMKKVCGHAQLRSVLEDLSGQITIPACHIPYACKYGIMVSSHESIPSIDTYERY